MKYVDENENLLKVVSWSTPKHIESVVDIIKKQTDVQCSLDFELESLLSNSTFDMFVEIATKKKVNLDNVMISFSINKNNFSKYEFEEFAKMQQKIGSNQLYLRQSDVLWTAQEVTTAQEKLEEVTKQASNIRLSPLEQVLVVMDNIAQNEYKSENQDESSLISRSVFGVLNSDKIVCSGFANLFKSSVDYIDNPNIKCFTCIVKIERENETSQKHEFCVLCINDEKYGIKGAYQFDPTWCAGSESLAYFMLNFEDLKHLRNTTFVPQNDSAFVPLFENKKVLMIQNLNQNILEFFEEMGVDLTEARSNYVEKVLLARENEYLEKLNKLNSIKSIAVQTLKDCEYISSNQEELLKKLLSNLSNRKLNSETFEKELRRLKKSFKKEPQSQEQKTLSCILAWYNQAVDHHQQNNENMLDGLKLNGKGKIENVGFESRFLAKQMKEYFQNSTPVAYESIKMAYENALVLGKGTNPWLAKDKINMLMKNTSDKVKIDFVVPGCTSEIITKTARVECFNERKMREIERRKNAKEKKLAKQQNMSNQKIDEEKTTQC